MQNKITKLVNEFFKKLNIDTTSIEIINVDKTNTFNIKIKTDESWMFIWPHGRTFDALQNILKLMSSKTNWEKIKLHLEINDYMKTKNDRLLDFIKHKIHILEKTWKDITLPFYSSYERKKIHWFVHELKQSWIFTKSVWEWKERRLHIYKEEVKHKLTIDIDWDDI